MASLKLVVHLLLISALSALAVIGAVEALTKGPQPHLEVRGLSYNNGVVRQHVAPVGAEILRGEWTANVKRGVDLICNGNGSGPYDGGPIEMDLDTWVGDDCGNPKPPFTMSASWTTVAPDGSRITVFKSLEVTE